MGNDGLRPAGWYADPREFGKARWWDGLGWTDKVDTLESVTQALDAELQALRGALVETRDLMLLQEVGIYEFGVLLRDSTQYREELDKLSNEVKAIIKAGRAASGTKKWAINGSDKEGAKMVVDITKLMLRAYNSEVEALLRSLRPYRLQAAQERLEKMRESISNLGRAMKLEITAEYHRLRLRELQLTADYLQKLDEEKEAERAERERLREEELARRDFEREQARLEKERQHYVSALEALRVRGDGDIGALEVKLREVDEAIDGVRRRAANVRAGYVYIISNIGAFGGRVIKIGLTRRLDPMDRVRELGDASVPFRFDVHAILFSEDAVSLENGLHARFASRRVNLVNTHREFFYAQPGEVRAALVELNAHMLSFKEEPEAIEWFQSEAQRRAQADGSFRP